MFYILPQDSLRRILLAAARLSSLALGFGLVYMVADFFPNDFGVDVTCWGLQL